MTSAKGVGVPVKLLHEAEGHVITVRAQAFGHDGPPSSLSGSKIIMQKNWLLGKNGLDVCQVELKSGEAYRGELAEAEDSWNVQLKNVTATAKVCWCLHSADYPSAHRFLLPTFMLYDYP